MAQMPEEGKLFKQVDTNWKDVMRNTVRDPKVGGEGRGRGERKFGRIVTCRAEEEEGRRRTNRGANSSSYPLSLTSSPQPISSPPPISGSGGHVTAWPL